MEIALLHTADVHVATFDALFDSLHVGANITHLVRPDLLEDARAYGLDSVQAHTIAALQTLSGADAVICTCSTLGPLADQMARDAPHILRIDRPMMETACKTGPDILVAICLESTRQSTLALLQECAAERGRAIRPQVVLCASAWACFENGDTQGYAAEIADAVRNALKSGAKPDCILLAQASMTVAEEPLADVGVPVMSSPLMAAKQAAAIATSHQAENSS
ncbi:aspartate/glutamate racemase family protein [Yoonia sediminilitoris]|uniref:Asp/Glu/hydantoin racemase n=1 Tax=Yoonia sediminilitoris TaxID=1286148 RepID=A0A2T6KMY8_9RHOB|nr:aspartate/glutamate racemase family protein [Yoonia sediminilitoris]PUB17588.1 hypothetical protein C8N45_102600 [Yoonia sediminilitoris]RCW97883.1 hypothetical protein DFP92_102600 [Yoonia sediminilitoris]